MSVMSKKLYPLFAVLLGTILVGCADDFDRNFEFDEYTPSVIMQAKQLIESGNIKVSLLNLENAYLNEKEKNTKANAKADFSIRWSEYRVKTEGTVDVVYVPIKLNKKKTQAFTLHTDDGRMKGFSNQYYCTLIMVAGKNGKGFDAIMATYLYGGNMKEDDVKRMGRDFESAGYTGYYITSNLDGTMLAGRYIEDGETKFGFRQNPLPPSKRKEVKTETDSDTINNHNHNHDNHRLFLNINPFKYAKKTKSGSDIEWFLTHCSICGELWSDCTCVEIYPECEYCHTDIINGYCGYACTLCDVCMWGFPNHSHYYGPEYGGGYTPPSTGGGGGTYWGGDPDPEPEPEPEPLSPKDIAKGRIVDIFYNNTPYLRDYSEEADPPCGWCLTGWRTVWSAAGLDCPSCELAKDYGPTLIQLGFVEIPVTWNYANRPTPEQYTPQIGDTRVWEPWPGKKSQAGHIDWWNGSNWVSDFRQNNEWWPGEGYRTNHPPYKIYR